MSDAPISRQDPGWLQRHWGKATAVTVALGGFLSWYDGVRRNGTLFLCDTIGHVIEMEVCSKNAPLSEDAWQRSLDYLHEKQREGTLTRDQEDQKKRLEAYFVDRVIARLSKDAGLGTQVDERAQEDRMTAARETVEQGDAEERRALAMIAEGDVTGGLQLLAEAASTSTTGNVRLWRRIGRLAYDVDTERAIEAYKCRLPRFLPDRFPNCVSGNCGLDRSVPVDLWGWERILRARPLVRRLRSRPRLPEPPHSKERLS